MNNEFIVPTGYVIRDYMEYCDLNQKEFATRLGVSEKHISNFLNGKIKLTDELALKIEKVIWQVNASYWLNYEVKYREYVARSNEIEKMYSIEQLKQYAKRFKFAEVFKGSSLNINEQAIEMLKILGIAGFDQFEKTYSNLCLDFKEDGGSLESIAIWLNLARNEVLSQNEELLSVDFHKELLFNNLNKLKNISLNDNYNKSLISARKLLNSLGVYLVILEPLSNSKVRGVLSKYSNNPAIFISGRFQTHDHVWFALLHEIGHLLLHFTNNTIISFEDHQNLKQTKEMEADKFARDFFINEISYNEFVKQLLSENEIIRFAYSQNTLPGIVVARLQHDGFIEYNQFNHLKNKSQ